MKRILFYSLAIVAACVMMASCEGCVKKATKKVTNMGLSAVEGIAEAVQERGDSTAQKIADAGGEVIKGVGRSIDRQLNEHAAHVASVVGRTLVQTIDGLDQGITNEFYTELISKEEFCSDVSLDFFGKINTQAVTDAYFIILKEGNYSFKFEFCDDNCKTLKLTKTATFKEIKKDKKYTVVSFAYNADEELILESTKCVKITVSRK